MNGWSGRRSKIFKQLSGLGFKLDPVHARKFLYNDMDGKPVHLRTAEPTNSRGYDFWNLNFTDVHPGADLLLALCYQGRVLYLLRVPPEDIPDRSKMVSSTAIDSSHWSKFIVWPN